MILHSDVSGGLDKYSDDKKTGYSIIKGRLLAGELQALLDLDNKRALNFAHNFIEATIDLHLAKEKKYLCLLLYRAPKALELTHLHEILSKFSQISSGVIENALGQLFKFYVRENLMSVDEMIKGPLLTITKQRIKIKKKADTKIFKTILNQALKITQNSYQDFLERAIESIREDKSLKAFL